MPIKLQNKELDSLHTELLSKAQKSPEYRADTKVLDRILGIVGARSALGMLPITGDEVAKKLKSGKLTLEQKLDLARRGMDNKEAADIRLLLADPDFQKLLDPVVSNFLHACIGLEPLRNVDSVERTGATGAAAPSTPERVAVAKMRDLVKSGALRNYYAAAIGEVDNPALKKEALELFAQLPVINTFSTAEDYVRLGFWTMAPRGYEQMLESARYLPGRQLLVETTVNADAKAAFAALTSENDVLTYDPKGVKAVTYRATLVGEDPKHADHFVVAVDSPKGQAPTTISVSKKRVFELNQPTELSTHYVNSPDKQLMPYNGVTWTMDYTSPWAKAKLAEIAIKMDELVQKLDFTKAVTAPSGGVLSVITRSDAQQMVDVQKQCARVVFDAIDMWYPKDYEFKDPGRCNDREEDVGRQAIKGTGMCIQQSTVLGGLLMPFAKPLGIDMQFIVGNVYRYITAESKNPFDDWEHGGHGWWQLTYRPSMTVLICDRTWRQAEHPLDRAYGFPYGDRYPRQTTPGYLPTPVLPTDVKMDVSVETFDRQFAQKGDGRENHISNSQPGSTPAGG